MSSSNSSRRCVRIISGPSVAIVNATPASTKRRTVSPDRLLVGKRSRKEVRRGADLEHCPALSEHSLELGVAGREDPVPDALRAERLEDFPELLASEVASLFSHVDRHAEARLARGLDHGDELRVVVAGSARPRPGDVHADDPARRPAHGLLDDDLVQAPVEGPSPSSG